MATAALALAVTEPAPVLAMSADGVVAVTRDESVVRLVDGRAMMDADGVVAAAILDRAIWIVTRGAREHALHRFDLTGALVAAVQSLGDLGDGVVISAARNGARLALIEGRRGVLVREGAGDRLTLDALGERTRDRRVLLPGRAVLERRGNALVPVRPAGIAALALPADLSNAAVTGGSLVLDGAALVELVSGDERVLLVHELRRGTVQRRIRVGGAAVLAIAERRGIIVLGDGDHLAFLDVREGRCIEEHVLPAPVRAAAIDTAGKQLVVLDAHGIVGAPRSACTSPAVEEPAIEDVASSDVESHDESSAGTLPGDVERVADPPALHVAPCAPFLADRPALPTPWLAPRASSLDPAELDAYLEDLRELVLAYVATAGGESDSTRAREAAASERFRVWDERGAPHVDVARQLGLTPFATVVLLLAAAPALWPDLPFVDEARLGDLLEAGARLRAELARELDDGAPLRRWGAIEVGGGIRPHAPLVVHPALLRRLAGADPVEPARPAIALEEVVASRRALEEVLAALRPGTPRARVVIRGRRGAGRRTIAASIAARAGHSVEAIEPTVDELRGALQSVALAGRVPCVTLATVDPAALHRARTILDAHPGPLFLRAAPGDAPPLEAGYLTLDLEALGHGERVDAWRSALVRHGLPAALATTLADRSRATVGVIEHVAATASSGDGVLAVLQQHRAGHLGRLANRVDRLARWEDLVLSDELRDTMRELIARVRLRGTVLEAWGMDRVVTSSRGVTALFQGPPGTGKTLAAGVIARELGYELWRIDLSRMMSKWLGETERNLGELFDAAEDGEVILLFDEADSLFGKRTEVRTAQDRYANVEVNYLLQRLDAFEGLAILTTNFGTAIDPAVRRRLSVQLQFPFPDEDERARLWRAHLPKTVPVAGDLALDDLARRFQLSGGYIRNAALRAVYLAAGEGTPLTQGHLLRAVQAEYRDKGKVATGGVLE